MRISCSKFLAAYVRTREDAENLCVKFLKEIRLFHIFLRVYNLNDCSENVQT